MKDIIRIEISNGDGCMHEDGIPRNVLITLVERLGEKTTFPSSTNKKLSHLFKAFSSAPLALPIPSSSTETKKDELVAEKIINANLNKIEVGDIILYKGPPSEDGDLQSMAEYRVIAIGRSSYSVVSDSAAVRIRLAVLPQHCQLMKKGARPGKQKPRVMEHTHTCDCGEINALVLEGESYVGTCTKCSTYIKVPRGTFRVSGSQETDPEMKDLIEQLKGVAFEP